MSARVFNPVIMSEMRRMLRGAGAGGSGGIAFPESGGQTSAAVASVGTLRRPDGEAVARVRRVLFGPVDHEDTRRFVDRELASQQTRDSERWGFDFVLEKERSSGPGTRRYVWQKVTPQEVPEPYALRGMQYLSKYAVDDDAPTPATTALEVVNATPTVQEVASTTTTTTKTSTTTTTKTTNQTRISDFLKTRKRTFNATKSSLAPATEPKKARMSNS